MNRSGKLLGYNRYVFLHCVIKYWTRFDENESRNALYIHEVDLWYAYVWIPIYRFYSRGTYDFFVLLHLCQFIKINTKHIFLFLQKS